MYANLRQRGQQIDRSSLYGSLDVTEKSATSYFLGMAMAKLFAAPLFATPWLFHVSMASGVSIFCWPVHLRSRLIAAVSIFLFHNIQQSASELSLCYDPNNDVIN